MLKLTFILSVFLCITFVTQAQDNWYKFNLSANYFYTTTSRVFYFPNSPDPVFRGQYEQLNHLKGWSFEFKFNVLKSLDIGLNAGYIYGSGLLNELIVIGPEGATRIRTVDGFSAFPVELTAYYIMPFSGERFRFYMGGGFGIYPGQFEREFADIKAVSKKVEMGFAIQVVAGLEYKIIDHISVKGEMRFRDPEIKNVSGYSGDNFQYKKSNYVIPTESFDTKVNIDGVAFTIGSSFFF